MRLWKEKVIWGGFPLTLGILDFLKNSPKSKKGLLFSGLGLASLFFFRNPERRSIKNQEFVISPADGKVVVCEKVNLPEFYPEPLWRIGIFMRLWDVHVNRIPVSGWIRETLYLKGEKRPVFSEKAFEKNEKQIYLIKRFDGIPFWVVQIAGKVARRIKPFVKSGDKVIQGEPLGIIKLGSRVELLFPKKAGLPLVKKGHKVFAGETVIAHVPFKLSKNPF